MTLQAAAAELPFALQRLLGAPLALAPAAAPVEVFAFSRNLQALTPVPVRTPDAPSMVAAYGMQDGVAIIPITGTLLHRLGGAEPAFGCTGYDGVYVNLAAALADPAVRGIVFDIDSPGGEIAGCVGLADAIAAARGRKPMLAIIDETANGAAYLLASAADRVVTPRTGSVGGLGVITLVMDFSRALDTAGVRVNVIQFGAHKVDGLPVLPLSPAGRATFQRHADTLGKLLITTAARNRGLTAGAVASMEGATFRGPDALRRRLVDEVADPHAAFADFARSLRGRRSAPRRAAGAR